jgi:Radical SAM superfamily
MKIAFCNVPAWGLHYPAGAPAILKSIAVSEGHQARCFDFAYDLFNGVSERNLSTYDELQTKLVIPSQWTRPVDGIPHLVLGDTEHDLIDTWIWLCVQKLIDYDPDWIGISVFSYWSHKSSMLLCAAIRQHMPDVKILLGGRGVTSTLFGPDRKSYLDAIAQTHLPTATEHTYYREWMLAAGLADTVIEGDSEQAIRDWLNSGSKKISMFADINDIKMGDIPYSDFDDYDLAGYPWHHERALPLSGSKGCVRACTFCDVPKIWPKFIFKDGHHIADEMVYLNHRYLAKEFYVTDSLANGSMVAYMEFLRKIADYKDSGQIAQDVVWTGHYITRPRQQIPAEMYQLMARTGAQGLGIGVESGSDRVRNEMKKKFSTADLDAEMAQFSANGITAVLLFFSGYPTEYWNDFLDTIHMFHRYQRYAADGTLQKLSLGTPYQFAYDTPVEDLTDSYQMVIGDFGDLWTAGVNRELHYLERVRRRMIMQEVCCLLNLPVSRNYYELLFMMNTVKSKREEIMQFFGLDSYEFVTHANITGDQRLGDHVFMPPEVQDHMMQGVSTACIKLVVDFESDDAWQPVVSVQIGDHLHEVAITHNGQEIVLDGHLPAHSNLSVQLTNQPAARTHFWTGDDANHYSCKQVMIRTFELNGVDLIRLGHLDQHFDQLLLADPAGESHIRNANCWPVEHKHLWRLWTNINIQAWFEQPCLSQLCAWALDAQADQMPDWQIMDEFKQYLIDFHTS